MKNLVTLFSLIFLITTSLHASDSTNIRSIFDDFYQPDQIVEVTLQFDCKKLLRQKEKQEKFPATITYQRFDKQSITRTVQVRTRGKLRLSVCNFPPLKIDFNKEELKKEAFLSQFDNLKIVTHCQNNKSTDKQVLKEFLVYRLYNIVTDHSLRVQLLRIKYLDASGALYADEYAFLIESADALAYRLGCRESKKSIENVSELNPVVYNQMVLFEYMIGNVDWNIPALHNVEMFKSLNGGYRIVVPYDFDYSGIVQASYAIADSRVGQKYFGERVIVSDFTDEESMQAAARHFLEREEAIFNACNNFNLLTEEERNTVVKYLIPFFELIKNPKLSMKRFTNYGGYIPNR